MVFSPDGKLLASVGADYTESSVVLWDVATARQIRILGRQVMPGSAGTTFRTGLAFSADGRLLACCGADGFIRIWDVVTGAERNRWKNEMEDATLAFSPDGTELASALCGIRIWDLKTGTRRNVLLKSDTRIQSIRYTSDASCIAAQFEDSSVQWWDHKTRKEIKEVHGALLGFSAGGKWAAILRGKKVEMWDLDARRQVRTFPCPRGGSPLVVAAHTGAAFLPMAPAWQLQISR